MLFFFSGTDTRKTRLALEKALPKKGVVRITDAHTLADLAAALEGGGMFGDARTVVLDGTLGNAEMQAFVLAALKKMADADDAFFIIEEKTDAATRKAIEKYAEKSERFDAAKGKKDDSIFLLANALKRGDKKALWVSYQRALARDEAPEAIHGVLFWGAKQMVLAAREGSAERARGEKFVAELAEIPHTARRKGVELEYALERFILCV